MTAVPLHRPQSGTFACSAALMRPQRRALRRMVQGLLLGAVLLLGASAAWGQATFPENEALSTRSTLALTLKDLGTSSDTSNVAGQEARSRDDSVRGVVGTLVIGGLKLGGYSQTRDYKEKLSGIRIADERLNNAGYVAWQFEQAFADIDRLVLVYSQSYWREDFSYNSYARDHAVNSLYQGGFLYQYGPLIVGYSLGRERAELEIEDPAQTAVAETFEYDYSFVTGGLLFGSEQLGVALLAQRKEKPAVDGDVVDLEAGAEFQESVRLDLGPLSLAVNSHHLFEAFSGDSSRHLRELSYGMGWALGPYVTVEGSRRFIADRQRFTLFGVPTSYLGEREETLVSLVLRY